MLDFDGDDKKIPVRQQNYYFLLLILKNKRTI